MTTIKIANPIRTGFYLAAGVWLFTIFLGAVAGLVVLLLAAVGLVL